MKKNRILSIATAAMIAALYVVLSFVAYALGLSSGAIQIRFSEALTVLPFFTPAAIPGITIGCLLFNLLSGCAVLDVIFGSLATLLGALATYAIGCLLKKAPAVPKPAYLLLTVPPVLSNLLIVPWVLRIAYGLEDAYWYLAATVGAGEVISCCFFGMLLFSVLLPLRNTLFPSDPN